jgi:hypothetical protein
MADPAYKGERPDITRLEGPWWNLVEVYSCSGCGSLVIQAVKHWAACPALTGAAKSDSPPHQEKP